MYDTSQNYKDKVLEDSTQHELNIYIDGNKVDSNHIIDFKETLELFNNNEFCLGCTPEKDIEFEIDKRDLPEVYNEVSVETGVKYHKDIITEGESITVKEEEEIPLNLEIYGNSKQDEEPSPDYPSEVKSCGDNVNLFDATKYDYRNLANANVQINDKTCFRISATRADNTNCAVGFKVMDLAKYAGKTLIIKAYVKSNTSTNKAFFVLRQNNLDYTGTKTNELFDESQNTTNGVITLKYKVTDTINDNNRYLFIWFYATRGVVCNVGDYVDYKVKLVEGTEVGEYSLYGQGCINEVVENEDKDQSQTFTIPTQQPMRAIGDYKDTFIKKNGKWFERHYIERKVFDGVNNKFESKHVSIYTDTRGFYKFALEGKIIGVNGSTSYGKSNYLKYKNSNAQSAINQDCLWWENHDIYNYASIPFLTLTEANEWLVELNNSGNPFYIDYVLSTPTDLECTEEQNKILDELENAKSYKGVTHIYSTDEVEPYVKSTCGSEIIPMGNFTIQSVEDDEFKVKVKATDYMKKFADNNYDGSDLTYPQTMLQVLEDICKKIGVELGSTSFLNADKEISVYDNTVTARTYLGYIAEQAEGIAVIGRDGKLYIRQIGQDVVNFNINLFKDYKWGDKFKVSKVSYEDGIQDYKFGDETEDTVYIDQNNMYIVDSEQVKNIYNQIKDFEIYSFEGETIIDPAYDIGDILIIENKRIMYQGELEYAGKFKANIKSKIQAKTEQESMQTKQDNSSKIKRVQSEINQIDGKITQIIEEQDETSEKVSKHEQTIDSIKDTVSSNTTDINNNYQEIIDKLGDKAQKDEVISLENKVETIQTNTEYAIKVSEDIQTNGVSKVKTETGYTFDENGLTIEKTNAKTKSTLNETGLEVKDSTGSQEETLLKAGYDEETGETIVKSKNMNVEKYLTVGKYSRIEDYEEGTGVFWIGGNN